MYGSPSLNDWLHRQLGNEKKGMMQQRSLAGITQMETLGFKETLTVGA